MLNNTKWQFTIDQYHGKLFPFTYRSAKTMWIGMIDKAGYGRTYNEWGEVTGNKNRDKETGRSKIHIHMLRKYFRTYMAAVQVEGVNTLDVVEVLKGLPFSPPATQPIKQEFRSSPYRASNEWHK